MHCIKADAEVDGKVAGWQHRFHLAWLMKLVLALSIGWAALLEP
jgi:hypothetical protein